MSQKRNAKQNEKEMSLRKGYQEMAEINLLLANMYVEADNEALICCEENLTECE